MTEPKTGPAPEAAEENHKPKTVKRPRRLPNRGLIGAAALLAGMGQKFRIRTPVRASKPVPKGVRPPRCPDCSKEMAPRAGNTSARCWWRCECGAQVVTEAGKVVKP